MKVNSLLQWFYRLNNKSLAILISVIIIFQFSVFAIDMRYNMDLDDRYYQELLVEHILVLVNQLDDVNTNKQNQILNAAHIPDSTMSINATPKWPLQVQEQSLWNINEKLGSNIKQVALSIQLDNKMWLNVNANVIPFVSKLQRYIFIFELISTCLLLFLLWIMKRFTLSLNEIKEAALRLNNDLNSTPAQPMASSLAQQALQAINELQLRLQQLLQDRLQMIAAISHDLKSPLTRIRLRTEATSPLHYQRNMDDLDEMEAMINETLTFARDDHEQPAKNTLDISALLNAICNDFTDAGHVVNYIGTDERVTFFGVSLALKRAFINLIDNALKYAGSAEVNLYQQNGQIHVTISDHGPGLTAEQLEQVFQPFYRSQTSTAPHTHSTGLGLTIAKNIIVMHQGTLQLVRLQPRGLRAIVIFS